MNILPGVTEKLPGEFFHIFHYYPLLINPLLFYLNSNMMKRYLLPATPLAAMLLLTGCMDDNYDLSNIDTTTEVKVNGLTIPVNLKEVELDALIDIKEGDDIQVEDGIYVYSTKSDKPFGSDAITINPFNVETSAINPTFVTVKLSSSAAAPARRAAANALAYNVERMETPFDFEVKDIDEAVKKITKLGTPANKKLTFKLRLIFPAAITSNCSSIHIDELNIRFPEGLNGQSTLGTFANDVVTIRDYEVTGGVLAFDVTSDQLAMDETINGGQFKYSENITVESGRLSLTPNGASLDNEFTLETDYVLAPFEVTKFSGAIDKPIENLAIDPISLENLPDFLTQAGTNLILSNPQLYLELTNPVSEYSMKAHTGMAFTQVRNGRPSNENIVLPGGLTISDNLPAGAVYKFALSPEGTSLTPIAGYENAEKLPYPGLRDVLSGNGLPQSLNVTFDAPHVYGDNVADFPLDGNIDGISGNYIFRAPLALEPGTEIYKSGTEDDWSSEDLDRLYVTEVVLNASVTSEVPLGVKLGAQIINTAGQKVGKVVEEAYVPASCTDEQIEIKIVAESGDEINNIDGISYNAICIVTNDDKEAGKALAPNQSITLKNVRATVTGRYLYEDDK